MSFADRVSRKSGAWLFVYETPPSKNGETSVGRNGKLIRPNPSVPKSGILSSALNTAALLPNRRWNVGHPTCAAALPTRGAIDLTLVVRERTVAVPADHRLVAQVDRPCRGRILGAASVTAERYTAEGRRERTHEDVAPVVDQRRLVLDRSERRRELNAITLTLDRRGERRERVVADERDGGLGEPDGLVDRCQLFIALIDDRVADERRLEQLGVEAVVRDVGRNLESLRHRERILSERGRLIDVDALQDLIDRVRGDRAALRAQRRVFQVDLPREIRDVFDAAAVVPAILHVVVLQSAADVLHGSIRLDGREDLTVAQLIAEDHRYAARHAGAERSAGNDAQARLTDGVERERRLVRLDDELVAARKSGEGIREIARDQAARHLRWR